ncbi:Vms1/Ankzf1 family peptidyl-tRNA hydrolase [Spirillospora sp. NPDC047279]|uniref:baeRF2 domain-containing protein n=1 Tax=Spirillospora sp. NPDC047279 TaxID=3155478 RepID=UPI00340F4CFA
MDLSFLKSLYTRPGPYASVYADLTRTTEEAPKTPKLRWRALREKLEAEEAPAETLSAIEEIVGDDLSAHRSEGLIAFATEGETHVTRLPGPPLAETARLAPLPHVMPLLVQRGERFPYLLVDVHRPGGTITCVAADGTRTTLDVQGDEDSRKVKSTGETAQARVQRAAENTWKANAKKVGKEVDHAARKCGAELILISGDPQLRGALLEEISDGLLERTVEDTDEEHLLELKRTERLTTIVERFERELANNGRAVRGLKPTVEAARRGQVETLILPEDSPARVWVGPAPSDISLDLGELHRMGVDDPAEDRADAALIRAVAATDGDLAVVGGAKIGAILRYST